MIHIYTYIMCIYKHVYSHSISLNSPSNSWVDLVKTAWRQDLGVKPNHLSSTPGSGLSEVAQPADFDGPLWFKVFVHTINFEYFIDMHRSCLGHVPLDRITSKNRIVMAKAQVVFKLFLPPFTWGLQHVWFQVVPGNSGNPKNSDTMWYWYCLPPNFEVRSHPAGWRCCPGCTERQSSILCSWAVTGDACLLLAHVENGGNMCKIDSLTLSYRDDDRDVFLKLSDLGCWHLMCFFFRTVVRVCLGSWMFSSSEAPPTLKDSLLSQVGELQLISKTGENIRICIHYMIYTLHSVYIFDRGTSI